jgi:hypothetical protein
MSNAKSISIGPLVTGVAPKKMMILMSSIAKMALVIKSGSGRSTYLFIRLFIPSFDGSEALVFCSIHYSELKVERAEYPLLSAHTDQSKRSGRQGRYADRSESS